MVMQMTNDVCARRKCNNCRRPEEYTWKISPETVNSSQPERMSTTAQSPVKSGVAQSPVIATNRSGLSHFEAVNPALTTNRDEYSWTRPKLSRTPAAPAVVKRAVGAGVQDAGAMRPACSVPKIRVVWDPISRTYNWVYGDQVQRTAAGGAEDRLDGCVKSPQNCTPDVRRLDQLKKELMRLKRDYADRCLETRRSDVDRQRVGDHCRAEPSESVSLQRRYETEDSSDAQSSVTYTGDSENGYAASDEYETDGKSYGYACGSDDEWREYGSADSIATVPAARGQSFVSCTPPPPVRPVAKCVRSCCRMRDARSRASVHADQYYATDLDRTESCGTILSYATTDEDRYSYAVANDSRASVYTTADSSCESVHTVVQYTTWSPRPTARVEQRAQPVEKSLDDKPPWDRAPLKAPPRPQGMDRVESCRQMRLLWRQRADELAAETDRRFRSVRQKFFHIHCKPCRI